ncbi:hypothetical protein YC2023_091814 [Brassica napus]
MSFVVGGSGSGGGDGGGGSSQRHDASETDRKKKRYHRHTAQQIQRLESSFRECPHPDDKQRNLLSKELGLAPRQIKFWFQNRRTQLKAQHERADNSALKAENDKIRCENIAIREAIKHAICPNCGGPPVSEDPYLDEQKLRMENAHLRQELERMSTVASKYMGRPISSHISTLHPMHISPLDLSMTAPSLDFDLLPGSSMSSNFAVSDMDKPIMNDIALTAMDELLRLVHTNEPLWSRADGSREVLNLGSYENVFPRSSNRGKNHNVRIEASRSSGIVFMNAMSLVDMFMDSAKWAELFPSIVAASKTLAVVSSGMGGGGTHEGALHLMYEEMEVLSPLVATREFCELRYCQQIEQGSWIVVNVSYHLPQFVSHSHSYRFPSGCLIQDMPNGYSKVTWVEHTETEEKEPVHELYREMVHKGIAFGAERWVTTLQRMCERYASLLAPAASSLGGVIPSPEGKRSMMRLAHRMVSNYCISVSRSNNTRSTVVAELNDVGVRVTAHKSPEPNGTILSAATTFWLPNSPQNVFNFLKDERTRPQWDVLSNSNAVQEVAHIANGSHPGCCISVLRASSASQSNNMLILQETSIDSSGALVVYSPVDLSALNIAMNGDDTSYIPLLSSGFAISPDGNRNSPSAEQGGASSSSGYGGGGSLITVGFQIMVSNLPSAKLNMESVETVNNLIGTTVHQIKTGLSNCPSASTTA